MTAGAETFSVTVENHNQASGSAQVHQQVGVQFTESVRHATTIYNYGVNDPPERRHQVAVDLLDGGNPREAERLLRGLVMSGHITNERAYYYVLSIVSERSFIEITAELSEEIHRVRKLCAPLHGDEWSEALAVVITLLAHAHAEFTGGAVETELQGYHELAADRQTEIDRHLDLILSGAAQEQLSCQRKRTVAEERMSRGRLQRAWMFFEAHPQAPRKYETLPPRSDPRDWWWVLLGTAAVVTGLFHVVREGLSAAATIGILLFAVGSHVTLRCIVTRETHFLHATAVRDEFIAPLMEEPTTKLGDLVEYRFQKHSKLREWLDYSAGYREHLKRRLRAQYADVDMHHGEVTWLVDWHVERVDTLWRNGMHYDRVPTPTGMRIALLGRCAGVALWAFGTYLLLRNGHLEAVLLLAAHWGLLGGARLLARPRVRTLMDDRASSLLEEEQIAHEERVELLRDRPTDAEMARWMALDKLFLKDEALRRADLNERDLVTHVVLTERAPFARRGRVTSGPHRYEAYNVQIFLLTRYGMRAVRTYLDFATGDTKNEKRQMFPYDAVASASIEEKDGPGNRVFELTLVNSVKIAEVKENLRNSADVEVDGVEDLGPLVTQTSGFDSALRVLEAVATEGRDWIVRDEERKRRWALNWSR
jgi:hypothetical protein